MKWAKSQCFVVYSVLALALTACSMEASIERLVDQVDLLKAGGHAHGITSGSGQAKLTNTANYRVSSSVGVVGSTNKANTSEVYTTSGGYKVYGSVQGAIVSE